MNYRDWLILTTIDEERNLTKAAERLFISQPALSYRLQNLEKNLGIKILIRHANGVLFTPQGEYLLKYAQEMLQKWDYVKNYLQNMESTVQGDINLGVSSVIAKFKLAPLLKKFRKQFPQVKIILKTGSSTLELPKMLHDGEIDIALVRGDSWWEGPKHVIAQEPMCIVYSRNVPLKELPEIPWIRYKASATTQSERQLDKWWQEQFDCPLPPIIRVDTIEACIQMVYHGLGWCITPKLNITLHRSLFSVPVICQDGHTMLRKTFIMYSEEVLKQAVGKGFVDFILREYS